MRLGGSSVAFALGLALASPPQAAIAACPAMQIQRVSREDGAGMQPAPPNPVACVSGVPLAVAPGATFWRCAIEAPEGQKLAEDDWTDALLLMREGEWPRAWADQVTAGRYDAFHVVTADLDGDGNAERVVATWNTQGNGLGVNHWTIRVFSSDWDMIGIYEDVQDWGPSSVLRAPSYRSGCDLALSRYAEADAEGAGGLTLEVRFARMTAGRMVDATDRERQGRRLTEALQRTREEHFARDEGQIEGDVVNWLGGKAR